MPDFKSWIKAAGIRAIKTMAQTATASLTVGMAMSEVDWINLGSVTFLSGILSIITSVAGLPEVKE